MCGIAGLFRLDAPATTGDALAVRRMLDAQATRGPDGSDLLRDGPAVLGHRRLDIIDLSDAAREPLPNEDHSIWVTFNGEIYNFVELRAELVALGHRFRSRTDGEVLVHGTRRGEPRVSSGGAVAFAERSLDEGARARQVADLHGTEHHEIRMTSTDFRLGLAGFFEAMDQPTNDGVNTYFISQAARKTGLTVVLSGAGADEVFFLGLTSAELDGLLGEAFAHVPPGAASSPPAAFNRLVTSRYLHDQLLRDTDVFSMAHSLEARVPYLDHTIVEYVARLPARLKLRPGVNKPLLVDAVGDPMVARQAARPKIGFSLPMRAWMEGHAGALGAMAQAANGLDRREVARLWSAFRAGRLHGSRAWALVVLGAAGGWGSGSTTSGSAGSSSTSRAAR